MSIVSTVIVSDTQSGGRRRVAYRCTDHLGGTYEYGPVITVDQAFDAEAYKSVVAARVAAQIANSEADGLLE